MTLQEENEFLRKENVRLLENLADLRRRHEGIWECVETVACGMTIECGKCGKTKPCLCDRG